MTIESAAIGAMIACLLFVVQHVAAFALLLLTAAAAGTAVTGTRFPLALRAILGLAIAGQIFAALAAFGALKPWVMAALIAIALIAGATRIEWRNLNGLALLACTPLFALALYPPLAFDETMYHLPYVRAIAQSGAIRFLPDLRNPVFPQLHELLCVPMFLWVGDTATHLVALAELVLLAALLFAWARPHLAGFVAVALLLGNPIALHHATITYVDLALTLFVAAGFYCLDRDDAVAAGFLLGTACSVKYLGLYFALASLLYLAITRRKLLAPFTLALALGLVPTYGRIVALTGNPLFPFFGATPWTLALGDSGKPVAGLLRLFWDITFARERVNQQPPYSPLFAVALLLTFLAARRDRRAAFLSLVCIGYLLAFVTVMHRDSRYLLPLLPLVTAIAAPAIARHRRLAIACCTLSLAASLAYIGLRLARLGSMPLDAAQRQHFLEQRVPEYRALLHRDPGPIYVCAAEELKYFGGDDMRGDLVGPFANEIVFADLTRLHARNVLLGKRCPAEWRRLIAPPSFERIYADTNAELWRASAASR